MNKLTLMPRRKFVQSTMAASAAVASGVVVVGCGNDVAPAPFIDAQVNDDKNAGDAYGTVKLDLARYPDLQPVGGAITVRLQKLPPDPARTFAVTEAVLVVHLNEKNDPVNMMPAYVAMDSACPHAACPLGFSKKDQLVECPCHSSQFAPMPSQQMACTTDVIHPPAVVGPRFYPNLQVLPGALIIDFKGPSSKLAVSGGKLTLPIAQYPSLARPGGTQFFACGEIQGFPNPMVIVRKDASTFAALDATCTHQQCPVAYMSGPNDLECPCHGSRFGLDGGVLHGPATLPLTAFTASFDGTNLVIKVG